MQLLWRRLRGDSFTFDSPQRKLILLARARAEAALRTCEELKGLAALALSQMRPLTQSTSSKWKLVGYGLNQLPCHPALLTSFLCAVTGGKQTLINIWRDNPTYWKQPTTQNFGKAAATLLSALPLWIIFTNGARLHPIRVRGSDFSRYPCPSEQQE